MTQKSKFDIPILVPMFNLFETIYYKERKIADYNYMVVGQVCIDKQFRGLGILDNCYAAYRENFIDRYDFAITEIVSTNSRSLSAHTRIGFNKITSYLAPGNIEWIVVVWDWKGGR